MTRCLTGSTSPALTAAIFTLVYIALAIGHVPGLRVDRAGIALVGATLMLVARAISFDEAVSRTSIDYPTIALLFGMMVVVAYLRISRLLERITHVVLDRIRTPYGLLAVTIGLSGVLSAFLINDIVCLALTPLVYRLARRLGCDPVPHLIAVATAANVGSVGTVTGNPQNIFIGSHSRIGYFRFAERLLPIAILGLAINFVVVAVAYRRRLSRGNASDGEFRHRSAPVFAADNEANKRRARNRTLRRMQWKSGLVTLVAVAMFFTGLPLELIALAAASVLLLGRTKPEHIYREIDWSLLVLFTGLFVVVHAFQLQVVSCWQIESWDWLLRRPVESLSLACAALSNVVSNVPAVLVLEPLVRAMPDAGRETAWLTMAMSSTLAGNLTVLGSIANLIVVERARREGLPISFWEYCRVGAPVTVLTILLGIGWLTFFPY